MQKRFALVALTQLLLAVPAFNANTKLSALQFFVGHWQGTARGEPGSGTVERDYEFVRNDTFIRVRNKSIYPLQEKNLKGETHEDFGLFSYDGNRKKHVLRQFHVEGFVNQYVEDTFAPDGKKMVFVTEAIENVPAGRRARETYQITNDDEFIERFELAAPSEEFKLYSESAFKRAKAGKSNWQSQP
jgi:hypothetical protein